MNRNASVFLLSVLFGLSAGMSTLTAQVTTLYAFSGLAAGDLFGSSMCAADVNKDGYLDIIGGSREALSKAGQVLVFSGKDGSRLYTFNGTGAGDLFGRAVAGADVNKDGHADIISGAHFADPGNLSNAGQTTVYSGKDGTVLYTFNGLVAGDEFGRAVAVADVNRDGYADILVGAPKVNSGAGQVRIFSGKDGSVLFTLNAIASGGWLGENLAAAGDVNKDGFPDIIAGARLAGSGQALVYSGKDGSVLHTLNGSGQFGYAVSGAGDVNRDGYDDLIVGAWHASPGSRANAGQALVFSGLDGAVLHTFDGLVAGDNFGQFVSSAGDVDRDGHADLIVGATKADPGKLADAGQTRVFSGKDGHVLYTLNGQAAGEKLGFVGPGSDINKDGFPELLVGAPEASPNSISKAGQIRVFSVATTALTGTGNPSIGGTVDLHLLDPGGGGLPYQVASSLGTGPIPIDTRLLNLSPDPILFTSLSGLVPAIFSRYAGLLDSGGKGAAAINIPSIPALISLRIHSAFVTIKVGAPSNIQSISNTFSFVITK